LKKGSKQAIEVLRKKLVNEYVENVVMNEYNSTMEAKVTENEKRLNELVDNIKHLYKYLPK